jgi:SAM-dependent methyltransferase
MVLANMPALGTALDRNRAIYDDLWRHYSLFPHDGWSSWREIEPYAMREGARVLEIGPGKFPHVPVGRGVFLDLSTSALGELRAAGACCVRGASPLPFGDGSFDLVCLFEVIEHVDDDGALLDEIARVLVPGGTLFLSCPMNPAYWTYYDEVIGHVRRYRAADLEQRLAAHGFTIERSCARHDRMDRWFGALFGFGMKYLPGTTARIVKRYLPQVAAIADPWTDGPSLADGERRGGITLRARRG